ncbi:DNA polymerase II [uncultured Clostridium sp.]|nr:DNA polymerase II [uncultured Clostridium sp.]
MNPCEVSDKLIEQKISGWQIDRNLHKIPLYIFEINDNFRSLKELELFMGEDIRESTVSFDLNRYPNEEEIKELTTYCLHDVRMTTKVFEEVYYKYEAQRGLIEYFNLDEIMFNKTEAQLSAYILGAKRPNYDRNDTNEFEIIDTIRLSKYNDIKKWYEDYNNRDLKKYLRTTVYGIETDFGWGGLHSARKKYEAKDYIVNSDVSSFYPSIMIEYNLNSRNVKNPDKYKEIRDTRFNLKKEKNPIEKSLKIVLNSAYGACMDATNDLYDPRQGTAICVNGQLLLLDLIEKVELEFKDNAQFIQGNTDGVMFKFNSKEDVNRYLEICKTWCERTKMELEHDFIKKIIQKDVNNYVYIKENGEVKSKGAYVKKLSIIDNDLPIVNKAIKEKLINNIDIEDTINNCNKLIEFQKCVKITGKYSHAVHGDENINLKVLRVFASKRYFDYPIMKMKGDNKLEKISYTPDRVFIDNSNIKDKEVPENLDKSWYISLAKERLDSFVPENTITLFDFLDMTQN